MPFEAFHWSSGVTLLALLVYFWVTGKTGQARLKYGVKARPPAVRRSSSARSASSRTRWSS